MKYPAPLNATITLAVAICCTGMVHADSECPMPATQLDQQTAMQALALHDQFAMAASELPQLKMLLSDGFTIREVSDGNQGKDLGTVMTMNRDSYLENAKLAAAFSSGIKAYREQVSAHPVDNGLQLRFIETDTGTVMNLPIHIVSRNRADFALRNGCITINGWQFTELSNSNNDTTAQHEDLDPQESVPLGRP
jgi:hypothetical protein